MIILPYACYQSVTNTVWASLAKVERGDCGDALCCASPSSCSHKPSPSCQGDASVPRPYEYEAASEGMSHNGSQLAKQGTQIDGYGGASEAMSHNIYL